MKPQPNNPDGAQRPQPPLPGSPAAQDAGCLCPVIDNARGAGYFGLGTAWVMRLDCPIHGQVISTTGAAAQGEQK